MALNATIFPNISRIVAGTAVLFPNDSILLCDTSVAAVTMTLLEIPSGYWQTTWKLYILDNSNNAATNNITINAPSGYLINNTTSVVINVNGGGCVVTISSDTTFLGTLNYSTGGGGVTNVTATSPIASSGGATPNISINSAALTKVDDTNVTLTLGGSPTTSLLAATSLTLGWTGTLADSRIASAATWNAKSEIVAASNTGGTIVAACTNFKFDTNYFTVTNPSGNIAAITPVIEQMLASGTPANITNLGASLTTTIFNNGTIQLINEVYDDGNDYDPLTGIWTCPANGRYNLNCYAHYTHQATGWLSGMFTVGIMRSDLASQLCGGWFTPNQVTKHLDITASALGIELTAGYQLCCVVLNQLNLPYTTVVGDVIRLAVQRIK